MRCALRTACTNSELLCLLVCYMPLAAAKPKQIVAAAVAVSWFSRISINRNRSVVAGRGALIGLRRPLDRSRMGEVQFDGWRADAEARLASLAKPPGALGTLEDWCVTLCVAQKTLRP